MTLAQRIAAVVQVRSRLAGVPIPIIEEVLTQGFEAVAQLVPETIKVSELDEAEVDACEACQKLIDPVHPAGAATDSEGVYVCAECAASLRAAEEVARG